MPGKVEDLRVVKEVDQSPDLSFLEDEGRYKGVSAAQASKYRKQDQERLATYGDRWVMVGLWIEVHVNVGGTIQVIRTPGLWGIESDSKESYFRSIARDEYAQLKDILKQMGIRSVPPLSSAEWVDQG